MKVTPASEKMWPLLIAALAMGVIGYGLALVLPFWPATLIGAGMGVIVGMVVVAIF